MTCFKDIVAKPYKIQRMSSPKSPFHELPDLEEMGHAFELITGCSDITTKVYPSGSN